MNKKDFSDITNLEITKDIKDLVITRIMAQMPDNLKLCIGNEKESLNSSQMIEHIKEGDETGRQIIQSHLNFLKAQASGALISALNSVL